MNGDMIDGGRPLAFDDQAAWLRRFQSDAQGNLKALALRLREAMPERVTLQETSSGFFSRTTTISGVTVDMDPHRYILEFSNGRLKASVAMVVRDIVLNTKAIDPAEWFVKLAEETKTASDHAKRLAQSLSAFMST
jgi:hypothetical protein